MKAAAELQKAMLAALRADAALIAALGGQRLFDHTPARVTFPYITFGRIRVADWSTATEIGSEHLATLHVWSDAKGKAQALEIMELVRTRLHDAALTLAGHALVNLRMETAEVRYDEEVGVYHGAMRFRAVAEEV